MANVSGIVQIETKVNHDFSIAFQSVVAEQSVNVGTLVSLDKLSQISVPRRPQDQVPVIRHDAIGEYLHRTQLCGFANDAPERLII